MSKNDNSGRSKKWLVLLLALFAAAAGSRARRRKAEIVADRGSLAARPLGFNGGASSAQSRATTERPDDAVQSAAAESIASASASETAGPVDEPLGTSRETAASAGLGRSQSTESARGQAPESEAAPAEGRTEDHSSTDVMESTRPPSARGESDRRQTDQITQPMSFATLHSAEGDQSGPDVEAAGATLGRKVTFDDLTLVEGIGPKIAALLEAAGISTWRALASAKSSQLRAILDDAGPRMQMHDPASWPDQAELLADGAWTEFKALTDSLKGGRVTRRES